MKTLLSKHSANQIPLKHAEFRTDINGVKEWNSFISSKETEFTNKNFP